MKEHNDHIWPSSEGGPNKEYNKQRIPAKENLKKGSRMPNLNEVSESSNPIRLASEIDKYTSSNKFKTRRNKNRGFGGLPLR